MRRILAAMAACLLALAPAAAMDNPGPIALQVSGSDFQVGVAGTQTGTPVQLLTGMNASAFQVRFLYGSGGTKVNVYVQTTLDQGQTWIDIANIAFTTSSSTEMVNLSALDKLTTPTVPTNLTLSDNTTVDGILGDQLRAVVVSTGTYSGSLVSVRAVVR